MSEWRSRLTADEMSELFEVESLQDMDRRHLRELSVRKKAIMNRGIQRIKYRPHPKKVVDMDAERT